MLMTMGLAPSGLHWCSQGILKKTIFWLNCEKRFWQKGQRVPGDISNSENVKAKMLAVDPNLGSRTNHHRVENTKGLPYQGLNSKRHHASDSRKVSFTRWGNSFKIFSVSHILHYNVLDKCWFYYHFHFCMHFQQAVKKCFNKKIWKAAKQF